MIGTTLHCSEGFCDLHDFRINTPGICLRQDALRRSVELSTPRSVSHDEGLAGALERLAEILDEWPEAQPRHEATPNQPERPARRERRRGGTPL